MPARAVRLPYGFAFFAPSAVPAEGFSNRARVARFPLCPLPQGLRHAVGLHSGTVTHTRPQYSLLSDKKTNVYKGFKRPMKDDTAEARGLMPICGMTVYNIQEWKYGFSTAIRTYGAPEVCAFYMTKYITKDLKKIFGKFYWSSRNIDRNPTKVLSNTDFESVKGDIFHPQGTTLRFKYDFYANIGVDNIEDE